MKFFHTQQLVLPTAALFLFVGTTDAFSQNSLTSLNSAQPSLRSSITTRLYYEEESEWYSPPPAPLKPTSPEASSSAAIEQVPKLPMGVTPKTTTIEARIDLDEFLAVDERLCVVKFHAAWCKSCQKFGLHFNKLVAQYADWETKDGTVVQHNPVRIAEVEFGANTDLCKALGIKKLPAVFFYSGGVKIDGFAAGPSRFGLVRDTVQRYAGMSPQELQFEAKLEQGKKLVEEAARLQRFEEAAKARELRRRARTTPPRQPLVRSSSSRRNAPSSS